MEKEKIYNCYDLEKVRTITWWERVLLFFKPTYVSSETGSNIDERVTIFYKILGRKVYILKEEVLGYSGRKSNPTESEE